MKLVLEDEELISLYKYLKKNENDKNFKLNYLLKRLESIFYEEFSIEEIENLLYSYHENNQ